MSNVMSMSLDVVDEVLDGNLEKLAEIVSSLSEEAKVAYVPSMEEQQMREEKDFALVLFHPKNGLQNKYALYTPELTELNLAYLSEKQGTLPEEVIKIAAPNLCAAANKFGIKIPDKFKKYANTKNYSSNILDTRDINKISHDKKISESYEASEFALPESKKYPIDTENNVKEASDYFNRYHNEFNTAKDKLEFAANVKLAADKFNITVCDKINKYAELTRTFNPDFYDHIKVRESYLKTDQKDIADTYDNLLKKADELGPVKTAEVLYQIDKTAGLNYNYSRGIADPIISTLSANKEDSQIIDGVLVKNSSLSGIDDADLTTIVGNDVIEELKGEDGLAVLNSLPRPVRAEILDKLQ